MPRGVQNAQSHLILAFAQIKLSRAVVQLPETSDTATITRSLSFRASDGSVVATVGFIKPGMAEAATQSIELSAIDFQLLKTQLSTVSVLAAGKNGAPNSSTFRPPSPPPGHPLADRVDAAAEPAHIRRGHACFQRAGADVPRQRRAPLGTSAY